MRAKAEIPVDVVKEVVRRMYDAVVEFSPRTGVVCPVCKSALPPGCLGVARTTGWSGKVRERYHMCPVCTARFKSIETAE